jgi:adenylate kinase family enzyme
MSPGVGGDEPVERRAETPPEPSADPVRRTGRFAITGPAGSGKSTLGRQLAEIHRVPHIELDNLYNRRGWTAAPAEEFRQHVIDAIDASSGWVIDGRYHHLIDYIVWEHAQTLVWLDLPATVVLPRLLRRQIHQIVRREPRAHGDIETWRRTAQLLYLSIKRQRELRRTIPDLVERSELRHLDLVRLSTTAAVREWLRDQRRKASGGSAVT